MAVLVMKEVSSNLPWLTSTVFSGWKARPKALFHMHHGQNKMLPTNPNADTHVSGTDVEIHKKGKLIDGATDAGAKCRVWSAKCKVKGVECTVTCTV